MPVAEIGRYFAGEFAYLKADLDALALLANELKSKLSEHTHGGVTAGSGDTGAGPTITSPDVTIGTE
jgi:hypothetical protein